MTIAKTILQQLKALNFWALGSWGAKNLTAHAKGLSFKTSGSVKWKGVVTITLDEGKDLYVVKFSRLRKLNVIVDDLIEDVHVEDLIRIIDSRVM